VNKFTVQPVSRKRVTVTYTTATRTKLRKVKTGCITISHLPICNTSEKKVVTHYKVPHKHTKLIQLAIIFTWHAPKQGALIGYFLYAGSQRLNKAIVRVRKAPDYRIKVPWKKSGPYILVMVLKNGTPLQVKARVLRTATG
jgi:hypothetical protein